MRRQTVQTDKAVLKKEYNTVLQILRKTLDTGQGPGLHQNLNPQQIQQQQQLLSQFQAFGIHCLQRDSQYVQLKKEHESLTIKYNKKVKEYKKLNKELNQQSELLEKREKQVYRLSMNKITKTENYERTKREKKFEQYQYSYTLEQAKLESKDKAVQSQQTFQRMDQIIIRLNKQKEELKQQLQQSRNLHKDKILENQCLKIYIQKLVEDIKINGPWHSHYQNGLSSNGNTDEEEDEQDSIDDTDQNLSQVQSYVSQKFYTHQIKQNNDLKKEIIEQISDQERDVEIQEQKVQIANYQQQDLNSADKKQDNELFSQKQQQEKIDQNAQNVNEINKHTLLWKACIMVRNYIEKIAKT